MTIEFIPAICPKCGGELRVPKDLDILKCMYCGTDIILHETNNNPQPNVANWMKLAESVLETNPEEAYGYYQKVLEIEPENFLAWFGRTKSLQMQFKVANSRDKLFAMLGNKRIYEIVNDSQKAIQYCPKNEEDRLIDLIKIELYKFAMTLEANLIHFSVDQNFDFFEYFERYEYFFTIIDYLVLISPVEDGVHASYVDYAESGLQGCQFLSEKIPSQGDYHSWRNKITDWDQRYLKRIREGNPSYQPKY